MKMPKNNAKCSHNIFSHRLFLVFLLANVFFACGGIPKLRPGSTPADYRRPIYKIIIEGNTLFSDKEITSGLINTGSTGWWLWRDYKRFDPAELTKDASRIKGLYRHHGYFSTQVLSIKEERLVGGAVRIRISIKEGKPTKLTEVSVKFVDDRKGRFKESTEKLRTQISQEELQEQCCLHDTRKNDVFDHEKYLIAKSRLKRFMLNQGYAHVQIKGKAFVDRKKNIAQVEFNIDPGPKVVFSKLEIDGLKKLPDSLVANRVTWKEGDLFSQKNIDDTKGRLLRIGSFTTVDLKLGDGQRSDHGSVKIKVSEQSLREFRLGGGFALDAVQWEVRTRAEYTRNKFFFDPLSSLKITLTPAYRWLRTEENAAGFAGQGEVAFERNDFLYPLIVGTAGIAYSVERFESYTTAGPSLRFSVRRPIIDERIIIGSAWNLSGLSFPSLNESISSNDATSDNLGLSEDYRLGALEGSLALDFRDNAIEPRKGLYLSGHLEHGAGYLGGAFDYTTTEVDLRTYFPLSEHLVAAARGRYSRLIDGDFLPLTRRYFAGGSSSHRGFPQRRISPTVSGLTDEGEETTGFIGGEERLETSLELRLNVYPILDDWFGVCLLYTSPSPRDATLSRMPSSA